MAAQGNSCPPEVVNAWAARQKAKGKIKMLVNRVFGVCNYHPEPDLPSRPDTRSTVNYLVKVESEYTQCHGKNSQVNRHQYTELMH